VSTENIPVVDSITHNSGFGRRWLWVIEYKKFVCVFVCLFWLKRSPVCQDLLIHEVSRKHTMTDYIRYHSSGLVISSSQRPLPDNTQHSQQTDIHALGGIRNHNLSRRAAANLHLKLRGHWDRHKKHYFK
jgi:hypothetical protein